MSKTIQHNPPKARIAVNIGVTGHRALPKADINQLAGRIDEALRCVRDAVLALFGELSPYYAEGEPAFRLLSMLADGSDRIAAECGLGLGFRLHCPLPMDREKYEATFSSHGSRDEFGRLLAEAERIFEIECCSDSADRAYQNCGQVMLGHSDFLIAVWDGADSGMAGGTSDIVGLARQQDIPVVWVDSAAPHAIRFLHGDQEESRWVEGLQLALRELLSPARGGETGGEGDVFPAEYFREDVDKKSRWKLYSHMTALLSRRSGHSAEIRAGDEEGQSPSFCRGHFYCADALAMRYGGSYRSAGVLRQLLPFAAGIGLAVGFYAALLAGPGTASQSLGHFLDAASALGFALQAACFAAIIWLSRAEKRRRWLRKFIDYRMLSELLRQLECLGPAGLTVRGLHVPAYLGHVNVSWVNWHFRSIVREAGMPNAKLTAGGLAACTAQLRDMLQKQIRYHEGNAGKLYVIASRLEKFGIGVYYAGIAVTFLRAAVFCLTTGGRPLPLGEPERLYLTKVFNMLSMAVPLFPALAFGLSSQEGFDRIRLRSEAMIGKLEALAGKMERNPASDYNAFMRLCQNTTDLMLSEFTDWNAFIRTKPISDH